MKSVSGRSSKRAGDFPKFIGDCPPPDEKFSNLEKKIKLPIKLLVKITIAIVMKILFVELDEHQNYIVFFNF
jgi:hypothetical protein